jgi:hypothetical protein
MIVSRRTLELSPLIVLRQKVLSLNDIHGSITNYLSSVAVALFFREMARELALLLC